MSLSGRVASTMDVRSKCRRPPGHVQRQIDGAAPAADDFELSHHDGSSVQSRRPGTGRLQDEGAERVEERAGLLESERTPGGLYGAVGTASRGPQSSLPSSLVVSEGEACASGGGGFGSPPEQVQLLREAARRTREDLEGLCIRGRPAHQVRQTAPHQQSVSRLPIQQHAGENATRAAARRPVERPRGPCKARLLVRNAVRNHVQVSGGQHHPFTEAARSSKDSHHSPSRAMVSLPSLHLLRLARLVQRATPPLVACHIDVPAHSASTRFGSISTTDLPKLVSEGCLVRPSLSVSSRLRKKKKGARFVGRPHNFRGFPQPPVLRRRTL